eukprot:6210226-Pleurochrysis_carterae.AAC.4
MEVRLRCVNSCAELQQALRLDLGSCTSQRAQRCIDMTKKSRSQSAFCRRDSQRKDSNTKFHIVRSPQRREASNVINELRSLP